MYYLARPFINILYVADYQEAAELYRSSLDPDGYFYKTPEIGEFTGTDYYAYGYIVRPEADQSTGDGEASTYFSIFDNGDIAPTRTAQDGERSPNQGGIGGFNVIGSNGDVSPKSTGGADANNGTYGGVNGILNAGDVSPEADRFNGFIGGVNGVFNSGSVEPVANGRGSFGSGTNGFVGGVNGVGNDGAVAPKAGLDNGPIGGVNGIANNGSVSPEASRNNGTFGGVNGLLNQGDVDPVAGESNGLVLFGVTGFFNNGSVSPEAGENNGGYYGYIGGVNAIGSNGDLHNKAGNNSGWSIGVMNNGDVTSDAGRNKTEDQNGYTPLTIGLFNDGNTQDLSDKQAPVIGSVVIGFNRDGVLTYKPGFLGSQADFNTGVRTHFLFDYFMGRFYGPDYTEKGESVTAPEPDVESFDFVTPEVSALGAVNPSEIGSTFGEQTSTALEGLENEQTAQLAVARESFDSSFAQFEETVLSQADTDLTAELRPVAEQIDATVAEANISDTFEELDLSALDALDLSEAGIPGIYLLPTGEELNQIFAEMPDQPSTNFNDPTAIVDTITAYENYALDVAVVVLESSRDFFPSPEELAMFIDEIQGLDGGLEELSPGDIAPPVDPGSTDLGPTIEFLVQSEQDFVEEAFSIVTSEVDFLRFYLDSMNAVVRESVESYLGDMDTSALDDFMTEAGPVNIFEGMPMQMV